MTKFDKSVENDNVVELCTNLNFLLPLPTFLVAFTLEINQLIFSKVEKSFLALV